MIKWNVKILTINDLKEYEHNPRKISDKEFSKLVKSLQEDGYHQRILVNTDNVIIGGHQRKKALIKAGLSLSDTLEVLMPDRLLTVEELDRINIRDNLSFGEYDFDILRERFDDPLAKRRQRNLRLVTRSDDGHAKRASPTE